MNPFNNDSDSDDSSNDNSNSKLRINEKFASKFENEARFKELQRAKGILNERVDEDYSDASSDSSEDEDAEFLSHDLDVKILKTINSIRKKDPKIYDKDTTWFEKNNENNNDDEYSDSSYDNKKKKHKRKAFKDVLREQLLTNGADINSEDDDNNRIDYDTTDKKFAYDKEQEKIRKDFLKSMKSNNDSDDDNSSDDNFLMEKPKTNEEKEREAAEIKQALMEMNELGNLKSSNEQDKETDSFLTDYITKQKWKGDFGIIRKKHSDGEDSSSDEEENDKVDKFESKYNFRFEELQDGANLVSTFVKGHSRNVEGSLRRPDEKRKKERDARTERKEHEKRQKQEDLKRLKNLKREELESRLKRIKQLGGFRNEIDINQLDEDWDPEKHEELMNKTYGGDYYEEEDDEFTKDDGIDDELLAGPEDDEIYAEENADDELIEEEEKKSKRKRNKKKKNNYEEEEYGDEEGEYYGEDGDNENNDEEMTAEKILDELYKLDYEDIVAGIPCRFKYTKVEPDGYGLSAEEIMQAEDAELNQFVSLKRLSAYNIKQSNEDGEAREYKISKKRKKLRANVRERLAKEAEEAKELGLELKGTRKGSHKITDVENNNDDSKKKRSRRKKKTDNIDNNNNNVVVEKEVIIEKKDDVKINSNSNKDKKTKRSHDKTKKATNKVEEKTNKRLSLYK